jgi:hypothetical protein
MFLRKKLKSSKKVTKLPALTVLIINLPTENTHSTMMEKLAEAGEGGGGVPCMPIAHPHPLSLYHYIFHHVQSCSVLQLSGQTHSPYFISTPMYDTQSCCEFEITISVSVS